MGGGDLLPLDVQIPPEPPSHPRAHGEQASVNSHDVMLYPVCQINSDERLTTDRETVVLHTPGDEVSASECKHSWFPVQRINLHTLMSQRDRKTALTPATLLTASRQSAPQRLCIPEESLCAPLRLGPTPINSSLNARNQSEPLLS